MKKSRSFVFSIEALLSLAAAAALASYPLADGGSFYGEVHSAQLVQDFLEITVKSPENARALVEFSATGSSPLLEEKYAALLKQAGDYCLRLEARGKAMEVNCGAGGAGSGGAGGGDEFSGERIFWDGTGFSIARISLRVSQAGG